MTLLFHLIFVSFNGRRSFYTSIAFTRNIFQLMWNLPKKIFMTS